MKVLLVNPPRFNKKSVIREDRCEIIEKNSVLPPYSLLQIASLLRKNGHEVCLIDANGENIDYSTLEKRISEKEYEALIFRFISATFDWDMKVAAISKKYSGAHTIGICCTLVSFSETVLNEVKDLDIYLRHQYEVVAPEIIEKLSGRDDLSVVAGITYRQEGKIKINRDADPIKNYDDVPLPAYDLLKSFDLYYADTKHGQPFTIMYTSKGCSYNCIYCTMANSKWKPRSAESVMGELRYLKKNYNINTVMFFDETFTMDKKRVEKITQAMIDEKLNIKWYCNSRVDILDMDILERMKQAGCRAVCMGIESGSQKIIGGANKRISVDKSAQAIQMVKDVGIKAYCSFIMGLPGENATTVKETIEFIKKTLPTGGEVNVASPYPGTKLYDIALEKGWITKQIDFRSMNQSKSMMRTDELTTQEIDKARDKAYQALILNPKWWIQNIGYVIRNPNDFDLAYKYCINVFKLTLPH
jgi:radical SAM superfamily enzyme YgiQ (UPF0313 family)